MCHSDCNNRDQGNHYQRDMISIVEELREIAVLDED